MEGAPFFMANYQKLTMANDLGGNRSTKSKWKALEKLPAKHRVQGFAVKKIPVDGKGGVASNIEKIN